MAATTQSWTPGAKADGNPPRPQAARGPSCDHRTHSAPSFIGMGTLRPYRGSMSPLTAAVRRGVIAPVVRRPVRQTVACPTAADIDKEGTIDG